MAVVAVMNRVVDDQIAALTIALQGHRDECDRIALGWRQDSNDCSNCGVMAAALAIAALR